MIYRTKYPRNSSKKAFSLECLHQHLIVLLLFVFTAWPFTINAQSLEGFQSEFDRLKREFTELTRTEKSFSVFESEKEIIGRRASAIQDDIEKHIAGFDRLQKDKYQELIDDIECFDAFTKYHDINECPCLSSFNKLLNNLNGSVSSIWDKDNVVLGYATIGNFKFYFEYNKEDVIYRLGITSSDGKGGKSTFDTGSWGGVNIFDITEGQKILKLTNVQYKQFPKPNPMRKTDGCTDQFPRK